MDSSGIVSFVKTIDEKIESVGTGFFTKETGLILTCYHVLKTAGCCNIGNDIGFCFEGETRVFSAHLREFDPEIDVAILYTDTTQVKGYYLSSSGKAGDIFNTLGFPVGSRCGVTAHPSFERQSPDGLIELKDANKICKGFSGAPLLDNNGSVAGMISQVPQSIREVGSLLDVARAIPIETIISKFPSLLSMTKQNPTNHKGKFTSDEITSLSGIINDRKEEVDTIKPSAKTDKNAIPEPKKTAVSTKKKEIAVKRTEQGQQAQSFGSVAEENFYDLLRIWLDNTDANISYHLTPNSQIEFEVDLPSLRQGMPSVRTFWQIKSSAQKLKKHLYHELKSECFHLTFPKKAISSLREAARQHEHFYLAFAHDPSNARPSELCQRTTQERFEWYCVDISQQLVNDTQEDYIVIPEQNKLNLSTFSLLWSSLWVEIFYNPLKSKTVIEIPNLMDIIRLTHPHGNESILDLGNWDSLNKKLFGFKRELGEREYSKIGFPLGIGNALEVIKKKLYDVSSDLNTIQTYCPESLYGTANLWLFSRSYHGFMTASSQVVKINKHNNNLRILPLPEDPQNISALVKACLWHIVLLYSSLNVEVRIVYRPSRDAGSDHSYFGGGIGYFPWLSLSDDGVTWMMENSVDATNDQHLDFIREHMNNLFIDPYHSNLWEVAKNFKLHLNDLHTVSECPKQLFPKEDRFIEYPNLIFGNDAFRSLNSVRLRLS